MPKDGWETLMITRVCEKQGYKLSEKQIKTLPTDTAQLHREETCNHSQ